MFADSAITFQTGAPGTGGVSSFGEAARMTPSGYVQEGLQKLMVVSEDCVIAYAGDVRRATEVGALFKTLHRPLSSIEGTVAAVAASIDLTHSDLFEFLIARQTDAGAELWRWRSDSPVPKVIENEASIGSLESWHTDMTKQVVLLLSNGALDERRMLLSVTALIQSYGLHDPLFDQGVGGAICSLRLTPFGVEWLPDSNFLVVTNEMTTGHVITILHRSHAMVVSSSYETTIGPMAYLNSVTHPSADAWFEHWAVVIKRQLDAAAARYWIFLSPEWLNILIVDAEDVTNILPICRILPTAPGQYEVAFHDLLADVIRARPPVSGPDGGKPMALAFVSAASAVKSLNEMAQARKERRENAASIGDS
ncbi:hypothetical protein [Variovorax sp. LT1R16]|uniref:hypothetical protein n=1 Tax=Variovorax sp. LT1R16 TaxID=3443728 RepID=UPI003F483E10